MSSDAPGLPSTAWGKNPTLLECGHLAEPWAGYGSRDGVKIRECWRCRTWVPVLLVASDIDLTQPADREGEA